MQNHSKRSEIEGAMHLHSGYSNFPNIYFGKRHIGGYDDLLNLSKCDQTFSTLMKDLHEDLEICDVEYRKNFKNFKWCAYF